MKKLLFLIVSSLTCTFHSHGDECIDDTVCYDYCGYDTVVSLGLGCGYRHDDFRWAFPGFSPGVSIHEKWEGFNIGFIHGNGRILACQKYLLKVDFDYGWSGWEKIHRAKLIDYNSARTNERSKNEAKAKVYDISAAIGQEFCLDCYNLTLAPLIGWSYNHQNFENASFYSNKHHTSTYSWNGPWLGFETTYQICCPWQIYLDYSFHFGNFHAKVDEFFRGRDKRRKSYGNEVELGTIYQWCNPWFLAFKFNYKDYWTRNKHSTYEVQGGNKYHKRVDWNSCSIGVDLNYTF